VRAELPCWLQAAQRIYRGGEEPHAAAPTRLNTAAVDLVLALLATMADGHAGAVEGTVRLLVAHSPSSVEWGGSGAGTPVSDQIERELRVYVVPGDVSLAPPQTVSVPRETRWSKVSMAATG
jgi:hypothetical protein